MDDILIYNKTWEDHLAHIAAVMGVLETHNFFIKKSKCSFAQQSLSYLGHIVQQNGVSTDPDKVAVVMQWPQPQNVKELRGFLGLAGYYRRFIKHYGIISRPLTSLLKKGILFHWTPEVHQAFLLIKQALTEAPGLFLIWINLLCLRLMPATQA
ncbi:hypothetical protein QOZ80_4AG0328000 [Eleusine coracana subsp. coracana]|nr:hypothetical protein QOZ80_4AG0328000 [Eleusine coracana subsp. coracana]